MIDEQAELDKCTSLEEGIGYLRYKDEYNPEATLEDYRSWSLASRTLILDEFYFWNRDYSTRLAKLLPYFMSQMRKRSTSKDRLGRLELISVIPLRRTERSSR